MTKFITSESVTEGHPDKMCDIISDSILDAILVKDPYARVACETMVSTGMVMIGGEITTDCYVDIPKIAREAIYKIGYNHARDSFDSQTCAILTSIKEQSPDIAMGVDNLGAGDQGMMYGYASNETSTFMPAPIYYAHKLTKQLAAARKNGKIPYLRPDGKSQVTVEYNEEGVPARIDTIVVSAQHSDKIKDEYIKDDITKLVIQQAIPEDLVDTDTRIYINPTGRFVIGGPQADVGLTGRKIIVDTYGGVGRHGGGAFSGKDATKVDRSGAYAARWVAKNIVAAGFADKCEVQLSYAIGIAEPVSIDIDTFGTWTVPEEEIIEAIKWTFDLRPQIIIRNLDLRNPIYTKTAAYGHFGREDYEFPWEVCNKVDMLKRSI